MLTLILCFSALPFLLAPVLASIQEYRYLKAIRCTGTYTPGGVYSEYLRAMRLKKEVEIEDGLVKADREDIPSFFLAPAKVSTEEVECNVEEEACVLKNIIPVPIRSSRGDIEGSLISAMFASSRQQQIQSWTTAVLTDRNRGIIDNIAPALIRLELPDAKKQILESLRKKQGVSTGSSGSASPYHAFVSQLLAQGLKLTGLIIEVADTVNEVSLSLGAAVMIAKSDVALDWVLKTNNYRQLVREERTSKEAKFIDCYMDELFGLHLATGIPVIISNSLYTRVAMDGLLRSKALDEGQDKIINQQQAMYMQYPYFNSERDQGLWVKQLEQARARPAKTVLKINDIKDATTFLKMRLSEKRACLRASGILGLPRPREGPKKVDAIMIPLLDADVAYEVLRRLGETRGDFEMASKMEDFESRKPIIARAYREAVKRVNLLNLILLTLRDVNHIPAPPFFLVF